MESDRDSRQIPVHLWVCGHTLGRQQRRDRWLFLQRRISAESVADELDKVQLITRQVLAFAVANIEMVLEFVVEDRVDVHPVAVGHALGDVGAGHEKDSVGTRCYTLGGFHVVCLQQDGGR